MSKYIIDILKEEYKDIPLVLNGEVLLEKTYDNNGNLSGYLTITVEKLKELLNKTSDDLEQCGWTKYQHILDSFKKDSV